MKMIFFKGWAGLGVMMASMLAVVLLGLLAPSVFMQVLWNAVIFEGLGGLEIQLFQGLLLWLITLSVLSLIFKPEISIHFQKVSPPDDQLPSEKK